MDKEQQPDNQLTQDAEEIRRRNMGMNRKSQHDEYDSQDPDALSDGDRLGRGRNNGQVGTSDDLQSRKSQTGGNKYGPGKEYKV